MSKTTTAAAPKAKAPKAPKAAAPAATAAPAKEKSDLRKPQVRILELLNKAKEPIDRKTIAEKGELDAAWLTSWIGSHDETKRKANDEKHFPSLLTLKLVKISPTKDDGTGYEITAGGKKVLEKSKA